MATDIAPSGGRPGSGAGKEAAEAAMTPDPAPLPLPPTTTKATTGTETTAATAATTPGPKAVAWAKKALSLVLAQWLIIGFGLACVLAYFFPCTFNLMVFCFNTGLSTRSKGVGAKSLCEMRLEEGGELVALHKECPM